tara:strand:+ start:920 stop:1144 length:225 start_codon:yes stop_codon:yes gene_type:complete
MSAKAGSTTHVEYEIFRHIIKEVDLSNLYETMVVDDVSKDRFDKGAINCLKLIKNLAERRTHKLPKNHPDKVAK